MVINPNLILSHFTSHQSPLSSPTLTHSQSHHWPKLSLPVQALCHRSSLSNLADKHLKQSSTSRHFAGPSSTSQGHNSLIFLTLL